MPQAREITVVAGVVERAGEILICQRKRGSRHELKWEFPGGKVEPGESAEAALERELNEELGIRAEIGEELAAYDVQYPEGPLIHLKFHRVKEYRGEPSNREFEQIAWAGREQLADYDFLEGDFTFLRVLTTGSC